MRLHDPFLPAGKRAFCDDDHNERVFVRRLPVASAVVLFDPRAHEPLREAAWSPAAAEAEIRAIARDADEALRDGEWWPLHPLDDDGETPDALHGIYLGAAGVLWALDHLARAGLHEPRHDYARLAGEVLESYRRRPEFGGPVPALWIGEGGIALVAWLLAPAPELADRLAELAVAAPEGDTLELMWGSPGLLLIADVMLERTGEARWAAAWSAIAEDLLGRWGERAPHFWTQRLYGAEQEHVGPAHGLAGIVAALARRPELLPHARLLPGACAALEATAVRATAGRTGRPRSASRSCTGAGRSARSGATGRPASSRRWRRCPATASSTRCCWRAAS